MADPDLELGGGGGGLDLLALPFSLQLFLLFLPKIRGVGGPPLDPPLIDVIFSSTQLSRDFKVSNGGPISKKIPVKINRCLFKIRT